VEYDESENSLAAFTSYSTTRERLERWIDENNLCLRYCGLTGEEAICFNHQIKKCNGICNEEEDPELYNARAKDVIRQVSYANDNFIILDKGRTNEERALILIEDGKYKGFGYIDSTHQISTPEDCRDVIRQVNYYPDADAVVKGWMKTNRYYKTFPLKRSEESSELY
jgi:DNA polymerase-3 subunit epsilon